MQWEAVGMMSAALGIFGVVAYAAKWNNKAARIPYVSPLVAYAVTYGCT